LDKTELGPVGQARVPYSSGKVDRFVIMSVETVSEPTSSERAAGLSGPTSARTDLD